METNECRGMAANGCQQRRTHLILALDNNVKYSVTAANTEW